MEGFDRALGASGVIGNAVRVMRIATGEEADHVQDDGKSSRIEGRKKRAENMTPERRGEIAKKRLSS